MQYPVARALPAARGGGRSAQEGEEDGVGVQVVQRLEHGVEAAVDELGLAVDVGAARAGDLAREVEPAPIEHVDVLPLPAAVRLPQAKPADPAGAPHGGQRALDAAVGDAGKELAPDLGGE